MWPISKPRGVTLVEIMLALAVLSFMFVLIFQTFFAGFDILSGETSRTDNLAEANRAMERMGKELRYARSIQSAGTTSLTFWYMDENSDSTSEASELITYDWPSTAEAVIIRTKGSDQLILAKNVNSFSFTYDSGAVGAIRLITIAFQVQNGDETTTLYSKVRPRNL